MLSEELQLYSEQRQIWPKRGQFILAHYDEHAIVVYQAFRPQIAEEAIQSGRFGPSFSRNRMSWIKPNFLWMMYRSGWATKPNQERVLAIWLPRPFFDSICAAAVPAHFNPTSGRTQNEWSAAVARSDVRLQWDPDHNPSGNPLTRRAVQLGLRRKALAEYADRAALKIEDVTPLVELERENARAPFDRLRTPRERVYVPGDPDAVSALDLSTE